MVHFTEQNFSNYDLKSFAGIMQTRNSVVFESQVSQNPQIPNRGWGGGAAGVVYQFNFTPHFLISIFYILTQKVGGQLHHY